jgi:hypothetical protein
MKKSIKPLPPSAAGPAIAVEKAGGSGGKRETGGEGFEGGGGMPPVSHECDTGGLGATQIRFV